MQMEKTFANRVRKLRGEKGVSQQKVADAIGITKAGYQFYEYGEQLPSFATLPRLAKFFDVSADYLLGLSDDPHLPNMDEETRNLFLALKAFKGCTGMAQ